ncbi:transcription antiterminator [Clostridium aestuarii]|uniref:Transcription antiterminator n=1 Tax=Clostridium aestuarii TaxID=338193 RepID=A0ABT4CXC8_9CLOT|nr:transcription antiterminator [Clostridium aestuarii]MCY6483641.1 transcription antiterminator [Clostridium aestuarii]
MNIIKKVLNNNVVIANSSKQEVILVGKGIGFDFKKGIEVPENRIKSIFVKQDENNYERVLNSIDNEVVGISEEIISLAEKILNTKLNSAIHISLPDHINFAIKRIKKGMKIENPFINELRALYSKEYEIANNAINMINERFNIELPEDEAGFICMHIRGGITNQDARKSLAHTKKIGEIMNLISKLLRSNFDRNSFEYIRTLSHINFMIERVKSKEPIRNYLLESIKKELYYEFNIAIKVALKIENVFDIKVPEDEIGYIAVHLKRLSEV